MPKLNQIFTTAFAAYLLLLMVLPCSEAHAAHGKVHSSQIMQADDHHHAEMDICTPFCICTSCVVAVVMQPTLEFWIFIPENPSTKVSNFYQSVKSDFHGSIWQPPQLV